MRTYTDMVADAKTRIRETTIAEALTAFENSEPVVFLDCREINERNLGHIPGDVFIPRGRLEQDIEGRVERDQRVVLYCASGNRSALAADTLQQMGFVGATSLAQGWRGWVSGGGPVEG